MRARIPVYYHFFTLWHLLKDIFHNSAGFALKKKAGNLPLEKVMKIPHDKNRSNENSRFATFYRSKFFVAAFFFSRGTGFPKFPRDFLSPISDELMLNISFVLIASPFNTCLFPGIANFALLLQLLLLLLLLMLLLMLLLQLMEPLLLLVLLLLLLLSLWLL